MCDRGPRGPWGLCCCSNLSQERIDELGLDPPCDRCETTRCHRNINYKKYRNRRYKIISDKELLNTAKEALPLVCIGIIGALVRSINIKPFSAKDTCIRAVTSGFSCSLTLLYLYSATNFSIGLQGVICGVVGLLGADLFDAVRIRMYKDITGEAPQESAYTVPQDNEPQE